MALFFFGFLLLAMAVLIFGGMAQIRRLGRRDYRSTRDEDHD